MLAEKKKIKLLIGLIVLVVVLIVVLIAVHAVRAAGKADALPPVTPRPSAEVVVREKEVEKIVTVEKEISAEIVQESLREAGFLITEEYYFTEVVSYSSIKKLWNIDLGITESSYLASYDGVVTAGVDLTRAQVEKDEAEKRVTITLPAAAIENIDIDPESFVLYSEKAGLGNRLSVGNRLSAADFNNSLIELEQTAREKAVERGVLERAEKNARTLIGGLVGSLVDTAEYRVELNFA